MWEGSNTDSTAQAWHKEEDAVRNVFTSAVPFNTGLSANRRPRTVEELASVVGTLPPVPVRVGALRGLLRGYVAWSLGTPHCRL